MHNWEHYGRLPAYFLMATLVASCGGGGGSDLLSLNGQSAATIKTDIPNTAFAGLATSTSVSLILTDENGKPLASKPVTLAISGTAKLSTTSDVTDEKGVITFAITGNNVAEKGTVVATYADSAKNISRAAVKYEIVDGSKGESLYTITRSNTANIVIPTSGQTLTNISMVLKDESSKLATDGQVVEFSLSPGVAGVGRLVAASAKTVNGVVTASVDGLNQIAGDNILIATYVDNLGSRVSKSIPFKIVNQFEILLTAPTGELRTGDDSVTLTATVFSASQSLVKNAKVSFRILEKQPVTSSTGCTGTLASITNLNSTQFKDENTTDKKLDVALRGILTKNDILTDEFGQATTTLKVNDNRNGTRRVVVTVDDKALGEDKPYHCLDFNISGTTIAIDPKFINTSAEDQQVNTITMTAKNGRGFGIKDLDIDLNTVGASIKSVNNPTLPEGQQEVTSPYKFRTNDAGTAKANIIFNGSGKIVAKNDDYVPRLKSNEYPSEATSTVALSAAGVSVYFVAKPNSDEKISKGSIGNTCQTYVKLKSSGKSKNAVFASTLGELSAITLGSDASTACLTSTRPGTARVDVATTDGTIVGHADYLFVSSNPNKINLQADQSTLKPNGQTLITAEVLDVNDNPVEGAIVEFRRKQDQSSGSLSAALVVTDKNGIANVSFTAGNSDTAKDAVEISALIKAKAGANTVDIIPIKNVNLTVGGQALFISIAVGSVVLSLDQTTYALPLSVAITDAVGHPVSGRNVSIQVIPTRFMKGRYIHTTLSDWFAVGSIENDNFFGSAFFLDSFRTDPVGCANEDVNGNGILDLGEDTNGDGILTPGNPVTVVGDLITNDAGRSSFQIQYGKNYGTWLEVKVIASTEVSGSESRTQRVFPLPVADVDLTNTSISPPGGIFSEYGLPASIIVKGRRDPLSSTTGVLSEYTENNPAFELTTQGGTVVTQRPIKSCTLKKEDAPIYFLMPAP